MAKLPKDIVQLIEGEKLLGDGPLWDEVSDPQYVVFTHALTAGELAVGGFQLRANLSKRWVHRDAMLQLEYAPAGRRSEIPLWRIDWKRFHSHSNKTWPADAAFETYDGSHHHPFADNFLESEMRMRGTNLPAARALPSDPKTLSDLLALAGELFRINDIRLISLPVIGPDIFWQDD